MLIICHALLVSYFSVLISQDKDPKLGKDSIVKLMKSVDECIPVPKRSVEEPFLMPIEDVHSIANRGTVVTGRMERGVLKKGDKCDIVGLKSKLKTTVTGLL